MIGPFAAGAYMHRNCALYSPEVYHSPGGEWYNLEQCLARSLSVRCYSCRRAGASIGCHMSTCPRSYHVKCAWGTRWDFHRPDEGVFFFCPDHRDPNVRRGLGPFTRIDCQCPRYRQRCPDCSACIDNHCQCVSREVTRAFIRVEDLSGRHDKDGRSRRATL